MQECRPGPFYTGGIRKLLIGKYLSKMNNIKNSDDLNWLIQWYNNQCDGEWEHGNGISIVSLDNPGWHIIIDLQDTELNYKPFEKIVIENSETDWYRCFVRENKFEGACSPMNLLILLKIFHNWSKEIE